MRISKLLIISLMFLSIVALSFSSATAQQDQGAVSKGQAVLERVIDRYPKLDNFYKKPYLMGELTGQPRAAINIPLVDWQFLADHDRVALAAFVASVCADMKQLPFKYSIIPSNSPIAYKVEKNIKNMSKNSWVIFAGKISADGRDIFADKEVLSGQPR